MTQRSLDILRHELTHISDMLDDVFGYDPDTKVGLNPG